jgi:hypothetical protein
MVSLQCVLWATSGTTACSRYGRRCFLEAAFDHQKTSTNSPRVRRHHSGGYRQSGGSWKRSNAAVLCLLPVLLKLDDDVIDWIGTSKVPYPVPLPAMSLFLTFLHFVVEVRLLNSPIVYLDDLN